MDARAGVHHHAGGLVDGHQIGIFVQDTQRNLLGFGVQRRELGRLGLDGIAFPHDVGCAACGVVHPHPSLFDPILQPGAAVDLQMLMQKLVQPLARVGNGSGKGYRVQTAFYRDAAGKERSRDKITSCRFLSNPKPRW